MSRRAPRAEQRPTWVHLVEERLRTADDLMNVSALRVACGGTPDQIGTAARHLESHGVIERVAGDNGPWFYYKGEDTRTKIIAARKPEAAARSRRSIRRVATVTKVPTMTPVYFWDNLTDAQRQHLDYLLRGMSLLMMLPGVPPAPAPVAAPAVPKPRPVPDRVWKRSETGPACQAYFNENKVAILEGRITRRDLIKNLTELGIPNGTASSQLSKWGRAHGLATSRTPK